MHVAPNPSLSPHGHAIGLFPHHDRPTALRSALKHTEEQGFVSKNDRIEKADRKKVPPWQMSTGNMVQ